MLTMDTLALVQERSPEAAAVDELIALIAEHGDWVEIE
jgi:hypothetical protein